MRRTVLILVLVALAGAPALAQTPRTGGDDRNGFPGMGTRKPVAYECEDREDSAAISRITSKSATEQDLKLPTPNRFPRCFPSCYAPEAPAADAGKSFKGCGTFDQGVCELSNGQMWGDPYFLEQTTPQSLEPCKFPSSRSTKWAQMNKFIRESTDNMSASDVFVVAPDTQNWTDERTDDGLRRCVSATYYAKDMPLTKSRCGGANDAVVCEASLSATARAINVTHYRLDEAKKLQASGDAAGCRAAALEAIAVARGLPKWRDYMMSDRSWWINLTYKTRYDGSLSEDALFKKTASLGKSALDAYHACGGTGNAVTSEAQEQSFHACW
jgi:hypothetical protein